MSINEGNILKMKSKIDMYGKVDYFLPMGDNEVHLNPRIGEKIKLEFKGRINDIHDGEVIKKSYGQGFSYKNFIKLAQCDSCIMSPEKCHFHRGTCREPVWGEKNCMIDHYVYLSLTSNVKVGITRHTQLPTRWVDQGAVKAIPVVKVKDRLTSGLIEHEIKESFKDKTNWRAMLKNEYDDVDLVEEKERIFDEFADLLDDHDAEEVEGPITELIYPVLEYPTKVKSISFDKQPVIEGTLMGIKGQYLILDSCVVQIRRHNGYYLYLS